MVNAKTWQKGKGNKLKMSRGRHTLIMMGRGAFGKSKVGKQLDQGRAGSDTAAVVNLCERDKARVQIFCILS